MSEEILRIPDIPQELRLAAREGRLVPFIGAGVSRLAKCPSWDEFANGMLGQLVAKKAINYSQVEQIKSQISAPRVKLSLVRDIAEASEVILDYEDVIHPKGDVSDPDGRKLYISLAAIANVFVTTNYDYWLDTILAPPPILANVVISEKSDSADVEQRNIVYEVEDLSFDRLNVRNTVIHLHGSLRDPRSMIMTTGDYLRHYQNNSGSTGRSENKILTFLRHLFAQKVVLFIGYGLNDLEILEYILLKRGELAERKSFPVKHYMLQPFFSHEREMWPAPGSVDSILS